ncbi:hypothetical protein ACN0TX_12135 [Staphylococcus cohnii]|uniref:hypothetical protein n=1 Tax=Staphylococcus cohnii TaxID=29382 RepID=UPI003AF53DB0
MLNQKENEIVSYTKNEDKQSIDDIIKSLNSNYLQIKYEDKVINVVNSTGYDSLVKLSEQQQYEKFSGKYIYHIDKDFICIDVLDDIACFDEVDNMSDAILWLVK